MTLPNKTQLIIAAVLVVTGGLTIVNFPDYASSGWYLIILAITFFIFPGPQFFSRSRRSEQQQQHFREKVIAASNKPLAWWASPLPWLLLLLIIFLFSSFY